VIAPVPRALATIDARQRFRRAVVMSKSKLIVLIAVTLLAFGGCKPKAADITSLQRKEAANLVSEAQFAMSLRDYARAEGLLVKATALEFDNGNYWVSLGSMRVRLGQRPAAKKAYESALGAFEAAYSRDSKLTQPYLQQVYALALLGRVDDARKLLAKIEQKHADDPSVRAFLQGKQLDAMVKSALFKEIAL
jgi:tetratricopeptide (TPR) repeat protein